MPTGFNNQVTTAMMAMLLGVSRRQITYWDSLGLISGRRLSSAKRLRRHSRGRPPKSMNKHYDLDGLVRGAVIRELISAGISIKQMKRILPILHRRENPSGSGGTLLKTLLEDPVFIVMSDSNVWVGIGADAWERSKKIMEDSTVVTVLGLERIAKKATNLLDAISAFK